jgi:hypothetical protein
LTALRPKDGTNQDESRGFERQQESAALGTAKSEFNGHPRVYSKASPSTVFAYQRTPFTLAGRKCFREVSTHRPAGGWSTRSRSEVCQMERISVLRSPRLGFVLAAGRTPRPFHRRSRTGLHVRQPFNCGYCGINPFAFIAKAGQNFFDVHCVKRPHEQQSLRVPSLNWFYQRGFPDAVILCRMAGCGLGNRE